MNRRVGIDIIKENIDVKRITKYTHARFKCVKEQIGQIITRRGFKFDTYIKLENQATDLVDELQRQLDESPYHGFTVIGEENGRFTAKAPNIDVILVFELHLNGLKYRSSKLKETKDDNNVKKNTKYKRNGKQKQ